MASENKHAVPTTIKDSFFDDPFFKVNYVIIKLISNYLIKFLDICRIGGMTLINLCRVTTRLLRGKYQVIDDTCHLILSLIYFVFRNTKKIHAGFIL